MVITKSVFYQRDMGADMVQDHGIRQKVRALKTLEEMEREASCLTPMVTMTTNHYV